MAWGCALCLALAGGALLALLVQLLRWLRADGDLTLLWAEWRGKKPGKAARPPAAADRREGGGRVRGGARCRGGGFGALREGKGHGGLWGGEGFPGAGLKSPQLGGPSPWQLPRGLV